MTNPATFQTQTLLHLIPHHHRQLAEVPTLRRLPPRRAREHVRAAVEGDTRRSPSGGRRAGRDRKLLVRWSTVRRRSEALFGRETFFQQKRPQQARRLLGATLLRLCNTNFPYMYNMHHKFH